MPLHRFFTWFFRALAALFLFSLAGFVTLFALLWHEHRTPLTLPQPTGHFPVGRTTFAWVNNGETDELDPSPGAPRQVLVWMWYPSATPATAPPAEYLPAAWRVALAQHSGALMTKFLTRDLSLVRVHSTSDSPLSSEQPSYPVVVMRAGGGALTTDFTVLAEDLASHGYIVVGFDAPHRTTLVVLPDGRVVLRPRINDPEGLSSDQADRLINKLLPMWTSDTKFVVTQLQHLNLADPSGKFAGRLDLQHLGMFGHSFGGATALQFCHDDSRCKAGIDVDGAPYGTVVQDGLSQPFMFILSDHSRELSDLGGRQIYANIRSIYDRLPDGRLLITIRGAHHFSFSDQVLLKSRYLLKLLTSVAGFGGLDAHRGLTITSMYLHTFFDVYLKGAPPTLLTGVSSQFPEVQLDPH
jgi:platelet-activating factor acetylhydrolase isoform II